MSFVTVNDLVKTYPGNPPAEVLKRVSLSIEQGEVISIVGASGAGKSTLLHIIGALDKADSGSVKVGGVEVTQLNSSQENAFRNEQVGFVFQFHHLLPEFTSLENVMIPALIKGSNEKEVAVEAAQWLEKLGLKERMQHKPAMLSGGEQQRVAVARALINRPALVLADEPSGNLDARHAEELHRLFFDLRKETGATFIIVTHNENLANMADRKLTMRDGLIVE
jgi:lipoprotein-releasing system ATP-binding protein